MAVAEKPASVGTIKLAYYRVRCDTCGWISSSGSTSALAGKLIKHIDKEHGIRACYECVYEEEDGD